MSKHNELFIPLRDGYISDVTDEYRVFEEHDGTIEYFSFIYIYIFNDETKEIDTFKMTFLDYDGFTITGLTALKLILLDMDEDMIIEEFKKWIENTLHFIWDQE